MDSRQLHYLRTIIDQGSFTAAADVLFLTQPSLSTAIRGLEKELGTELLIRNRNGVSATEAGREVYRLATHVLDQMADTKHKIQELATGTTGQISLDVAPEFNWSYLPPLLRRLRHELPQVTLTLSDPEPIVTLRNIKSGRTDIGIMPSSDLERLTALHPDLNFEKLVTLPMVLGLPPEHPAAAPEIKAVHLREIRDTDWLVPTRHPEFPGLPESLDRFWALNPDARPNRVHQIATLQTALPLIAGGVGVSILPNFATGLNSDAFVHREILDDIPPLHMVMLWRSQNYLPPVVSRVLDLIRGKIAEVENDTAQDQESACRW